jgi:hypothetical protein
VIVGKELSCYTDSVYAVSIGDVMNHSADLQEFMAKKEQILSKITHLADFRPGSLVERYRRCGKPYCHCAKPGAKGHGPSYSLTRSVKGKTITKIIPKDEVEATRQQIQEYHRFREMIGELVETNERICDVRLEANKKASREAEKKG